ncbi:hypothetical protein A7982_13956 [Minicystis rosea]|nr:hypothetical protein A7982_13956 [Minicystis rosea]
MSTLSDLTKVGTPAPLPKGAVNANVPAPIRDLYEAFGVGTLCGQVRLLSTSQDDPEWRGYQNILEGPARLRRAGGSWPQISEDRFSKLVAWGVDVRGLLLVAGADTEILRLHVDGTLRTFASADALVEALLSEQHANSLRGMQKISESHSKWTDYDVAHGLPAIYRVGDDTAQHALLDALRRGDEPAADAALERVLGENVAAWALLDLLEAIAAGDTIEAELRASYAKEWFRLLHRRVTASVFETGQKRVSKMLSDEVGRDGFLAALAARAPVPDEVRAKLRCNVVRTPPDPFFTTPRENEARVELAASLTDAEARGLVSRPTDRPIDVLARVDEQARAFREADATLDVASLVAHVQALHPQERLAYAHLLARCGGWHEDTTPEREEFRTLERELPKAWPQLVLSLRETSEERMIALQILTRQKAAQALPFLASLVRSPTSARLMDDWPEHVANAFEALGGRVSKDMIEPLLEELPLTRAPRPFGVIMIYGSSQSRAAAYLLRHHVRDDRVFEALLCNFAEVYPHSRAVLKKKGDPRVIPALLAQLEREEKAASGEWDDDRQRRTPHKHYSDEFGILAKTLASLDVPRGVEALEAFRAYKRWESRQPL